MKIRRVGAKIFHADRQTDMAKLIVAFCNFTTPPKMNAPLPPEHLANVRLPVSSLSVFSISPPPKKTFYSAITHRVTQLRPLLLARSCPCAAPMDIRLSVQPATTRRPLTALHATHIAACHTKVSRRLS